MMKQTVNVSVLPEEVDEWKEIEKQENTQTHTHTREKKQEEQRRLRHTHWAL